MVMGLYCSAQTRDVSIISQALKAGFAIAIGTCKDVSVPMGLHYPISSRLGPGP